MNEQAIKQYLISCGMKQDRHGNFLSGCGQYRFHFQKISIRFEKKYVPAVTPYGYKPPTEWLNMTSDYFKNVRLDTRDRVCIVMGGKKIDAEKLAQREKVAA